MSIFIKYWNYAWKHQSLWIFWYRELSVGSPELFLLHHDDTTWRRAQKLGLMTNQRSDISLDDDSGLERLWYTSLGSGSGHRSVIEHVWVWHATWLRPVRGHVLHHMCLLSESSIAHLTHKWLLSGVDFEMLLEVEPFWVDEQSAHGAALVIGPVVIHVDVKVV